MPRNAAKREVKFTHPDKLYFPSGFTKGEMIHYYLEVGPFMLPHLKNRPVTLIRFPDGVKAESFYEKNAPSFTPTWVATHDVPRRAHEGDIHYILVNNVETLAWCANLGAIEFHPFLHRAPKLDRPTHVAFDLDPGEGADIFTCAEVAFLLRDLFRGLHLEAFPKVSGSKGIQLYVPLNTQATYETTSPFAKAVAELMAKRHPDLIVSQMSKLLRRGRVMIDWSQNSASKTTVSVYSMRGKRDEPFISMPLAWDELKRLCRKGDREALDFTPGEALQRLRSKGDLFAPVLTLKQSLPRAFAALGAKEEGPPAPKSQSSGAAGRRKGRRVASDAPPAGLETYAAKRDFSKTAEPAPSRAGRRIRRAKTPRFVIQKHAASRLHFDFRLEIEGTLKSWAVPKGLPYEKGVRRSAFQTEDHPIDYLDFEGTIPPGQYGGGTVMVWDIGTFEVLGGDWHEGDLKLRLNGEKLKGEWHIFRIRSDDAKPVWLIIKSGEAITALSDKLENTSVLSGRTMEKIAAARDREWQSDRGSPAE